MTKDLAFGNMEVEYTICGKLIMRKITRHPKLAKIRDDLIRQFYNDGFFYEEIGEIFRLQKSRVGQIINGQNKEIKTKKKVG